MQRTFEENDSETQRTEEGAAHSNDAFPYDALHR